MNDINHNTLQYYCIQYNWLMKQTFQCNLSKKKYSQFEKMKIWGKESKLSNNNKYAESIKKKIVKSITDFQCGDKLLDHENNEELYEE